MLKKDNGTIVIGMNDLDIKSNNGRYIRSTCPACRDTRNNPQDPSLSICLDTGGGICHHCGGHFFVSDIGTAKQKMHHLVNKGGMTWKSDRSLKMEAADDITRSFLKERGIDVKTAAKLGIGSKTIHGVHYMAFPFYENGELVNIQYKRDDLKKKEFCFEQGGKMVPWNIDSIIEADGKEPLLITEGMMDAMAIIQCGYRFAVSVPNGANSRMEVFDGYKTFIEKHFTHIIFAGDTDSAGIELRDKVKGYFDKMDVGVTEWKCSEGSEKDADAMLITGGAGAVKRCIENAAFGEDGGYSVITSDDAALWKRYEEGAPKGMTIGLPSVDKIMRFITGHLYVVTGYPGAGKSSFINYIAMCLLQRYGWRSLFFSPEKMPVEEHIGEMISIITGKKFDKAVLSREEMAEAVDFLAGNVFHINDECDTLRDILKTAAKIVRRHHVKLFVIDPFMYLRIGDLHGVSETTKITEMLQEIRRFAIKTDVLVILVAHPRKPNANGERPDLMQMLYEIAGSSGFYNVCDAGIMLERTDANGNKVEISCGKARTQALATIGKVSLNYMPVCGRYSEDGKRNTLENSLFSFWGNGADMQRYGASDAASEELPF